MQATAEATGHPLNEIVSILSPPIALLEAELRDAEGLGFSALGPVLDHTATTLGERADAAGAECELEFSVAIHAVRAARAICKHATVDDDQVMHSLLGSVSLLFAERADGGAS